MANLSIYNGLGSLVYTKQTGAGTDPDPHIPSVLVEPSENVIGKSGTPADLITVTLSLDTAAYADGDVMADSQVVTNAVRVAGGRATLKSVVVVDEDDVGQAFDILFFSSNVSLGTENAAPSITDANARNFLGFVKVAAADYIDLGGVKVATKTSCELMLEPASGRDIYVATIIRGAGTYTASGVSLKLGLVWD